MLFPVEFSKVVYNFIKREILPPHIRRRYMSFVSAMFYHIFDNATEQTNSTKSFSGTPLRLSLS
jgi:hypothetical protein